ncbi:MAG: Polysaccharide biosynthesis protein [Candidatus Cloacimonetes bacterium ADurb.Bin117]|nr:MAG: Polysaccharide biosynthesis protein [Candidatus Cloacimonetes bacterium ADurb.Bin117]HPB44199.1 polysaccharide biosynthesis C-terminal domain-containing protein [Candidatus Syntrophosphaera sp.]
MGFKANIASNLINQVLRIVIGFATSVITAQVLGPQGMGYVAYIILVFTLIGDFGHLGLNNANMYFMKRGGVPSGHLFSVNLTTLGLLFGTITAVLIFLRARGLVLASYGWTYILGGLLFVGSDLAYTNLHSWYIGDERILESNRKIIIVFLLKSALILILWFAGTLTPLSFFAVTVLGMFLNAVLLGFGVGQNYAPALDLGLVKAELSYGGILWLGAVCSFLHLRADQFMIKQMLNVSELGVYSIAVTLAELLFLVPISVSSALLGKLYNTSEPGVARSIMARTLKLTFYICTALALVGIPLSLLIPVIYGQAYAGAVSSVMVLLGGAVFASLAKVGMQYFFTLGRPKVHLYTTLATLIVNVGLNFLLIPRWGIFGAAFASSISYLGYGIFYLALFLGREKFSWRDLFAIDTEDVKALWKRP